MPVAALTLSVGSFAQATLGSDASGAYIKGRVLVSPKAGLPDAELNRIVGAHGGRARAIGRSGVFIVDLPAQASETAVANLLARNPHLKYAELDRVSRPNATANDPYVGSQWHLNKIGALTAWDASQGDGVTIAILDTGVDGAHPDLAPRLVAGWNFFDNNSDTSDVYNHGTGVAGAAAAAMNNAIGVAGVSGKARIMPIRIADATGYGSWSAMAQGLTYAADRGARVANISFSSAARSASVISAAQYMKNKGGLVFVSAGNTGTTSTASPTTSMFIVGATDAGDGRASWSTYGSAISLSAPGTSIYTTALGGGYVADNGTSFASPVAAAVAALVMAANPSLSGAQVESIVNTTAVDLGPAGRDAEFGVGRVDAARAVQTARSSSGTADTSAPSAAIQTPTAGASVSGVQSVAVSVADNVGVTRVDLRVDGAVVASDTTAPFGFSWDTKGVANGAHALSIVAYDAAGNAGASAGVAVSVANNVVADNTPPVVSLLNPGNGSSVSGRVSVSGVASDNAGTAGLTLALSIDGKEVARTTGGSLGYTWNTRKVAAGAHTLRLEARDAAGNVAATAVTVQR